MTPSPTGDTVIVRDVLVPECLTGRGSAFAGKMQEGCLRGDLVLQAGKSVELRPGEETRQPRLVLPALVEAHCHLDKCHTIDRMNGIGGDLLDAIAAQMADKANWTEADLRSRAARGLDEAVGAGCGLLRSHVDWGDTPEPPLAWGVIGELAEERRKTITIDRAALVSIQQMADPAFAKEVGKEIAATDGSLGSFILGHPEARDGIRQVLATADRFGLRVDFHVDEGLIPGLDGLIEIAKAVLETGFEGPVLAGHACSLMNLHGDTLKAAIDLIARAGITVAALPTTNLYLQGRAPGTPDRRGITRLRELAEAGVPIAVGSDNVADAFCPTGRHDPLAALNLAVLAAHLDPPLGRWLPAVTTNAAKALGRDPVFVAGAQVNDLRISDASSVAALISGRPKPLRPLTEILETARS